MVGFAIAYSWAPIAILITFGLFYYFSIPKETRTSSFRKKWGLCQIICLYQILALVVLFMYLLVMMNMSSDLQILLAYLYPFLEWYCNANPVLIAQGCCFIFRES